MATPSGILLVDKPGGVTSFAVVDRVRRRLVAADPALRARRTGGGPKPPRFRCGHAGTLDPLATGLLLVLVGRSSRLATFLSGLDKSYRATVRFGAETDTHDRAGSIVRQEDRPTDEATVQNALSGLRGTIDQVPPVISALKRDGQPLYKRVRAGENPAEPPPRKVEITRLEMVDIRSGSGEIEEIDLDIDCSSGTYVRSLARDLGRAVGSVAHLAELRRTRVGPFDVASALSGVLDREAAELLAHLQPPAAALPWAPTLALTSDQAAAVREGTQPEPHWFAGLGEVPAVGRAGRLVRLLDPAGELVAVVHQETLTDPPRLAAVLPREAPSCE